MADAENTQPFSVLEESQEKADKQATQEEQAPTEEAASTEPQLNDVADSGRTQEDIVKDVDQKAAQDTQETQQDGKAGEQSEAQVETEDKEAERTEEQAPSEEPAADVELSQQQEKSTEQEEEEPQSNENQDCTEDEQTPAGDSQQQVEEETTVQEEEEQNEDTQQTKDKPQMELSADERDRCLTYFSWKAMDGRIDLKGFKILFRLMGQTITSEDAETTFESGMKDANGTIDFKEFCRLYSKNCEAEHLRKAAMADSLNKLFPGLEGDEVDLKKVEGLLMKMQKPDLGMRLVREKSDLCATDIRFMLRALDKNKSGKISKSDLVDQLCQHMDL